MGSVELDLTRARFAGPIVVIELDMKFGVAGPAAARGRQRVDRRRRGGRRQRPRPPADAPAEGRPHVILTGKVTAGRWTSAARARAGLAGAGRPRPAPPRVSDYLSSSVGTPKSLLVAAHLFAHLACVEAGVRPRVAAATAVAGMGGQEVAHALLGDGPQLAAQLVVERRDRRERVADEVGELHVETWPAQARRRRATLHRPRPGRRRSPRRTAAAHSAMSLSSEASRRRWSGERGDRRDDVERVAVGLHDQRVGVLGDQGVELPQMRGRLQQPLPGHTRTASAAGRFGGIGRRADGRPRTAASGSSRAAGTAPGRSCCRTAPAEMRTHSWPTSAPIG